MVDKISKTERSSLMGKIKSKETKLEKGFRKILWKEGVRYRKNSSGYFGKPDIVIASKKIVIFIDSCFWHGCKKHCRVPEANRDYWLEKIKRNKERDELVTRFYRKNHWNLLRIWEHDILNKKRLAKILDIIRIIK